MKRRSQPRRDWSDARAKAEREVSCRVCGDWPVEAAHLIGRSRDKPKHENTRTLYVHPDSVVGLCELHHAQYDGHILDLLGYLTPEEEARAVLDAGGLELARRRLCPSQYRAGLGVRDGAEAA